MAKNLKVIAQKDINGTNKINAIFTRGGLWMQDFTASFRRDFEGQYCHAR